MKRTWIAALFLSTACGSAPFKPEMPHPSPERMRELLDASVAAPTGKPMQFGIRASSIVVFLGGAVELSCFVPESFGAGTIALGIAGQQLHAGEIQSSQTRLRIDHIDQCGEITAICVIDTAKGVRRAEQNIQVKGGMCDGSQVSESSRHP